MAKYYLIKNNVLLAELDADTATMIALPLLRSGDSMSLINQEHAQNLMANLSLTAAQALAALGLSDGRADLIKTLFIAPQIVSVNTNIEGAAYKISDVGAYGLYQVDSNPANLLTLHNELWAKTPIQTLGMIAQVAVFGTSFALSAMRTVTGMTQAQALARRDRIATYLESVGKTNTGALRAAVNENTQAFGIATALGMTAAQLWAQMHI